MDEDNIRQFASTWWEIADVDQLCEFNEVSMSVEERIHFLEENQKRLVEVMIEAGWAFLEDKFRERMEAKL